MPLADRGTQALVRRVLSDPTQFPPEFLNWLVQQLNSSPFVKLTTSQLPTVTAISYVGPSGAATFKNSCANFGSGYENAGFYKDPFGRVYLCGVVQSFTAAPVVIFTLPAGYRPVGTARYAVESNGAIAIVEVGSGGDVTVISGSNVKLTLSGINFRAYS